MVNNDQFSNGLVLEQYPSALMYRALVDPEGTLPAVSLELERPAVFPDGSVKTLFTTTFKGRIIGGGSVMQRKFSAGEKLAWFGNVWRECNCAVKGVGMTTYLLAAACMTEQGYVFTSGKPTSAYAKAVWDRLVRAGVAEITEPFELVIPVDRHAQRQYNRWPVVDQYHGEARFLAS